LEILREAAQHGRKQIATILVIFLLLAVTGSVINPLHEATDELRHYRFVQHINQLQRLPVQGELPCQVQGHHPPLFYALGALATFWIDTGRDVCYSPPGNPFWQYRYWEVGRDNKNLYLHGAEEAFPWSGEALAAHLVRFLNILFGMGTVLLTWWLARLIWPDRPYLALGSVAFVAFNPMFVYLSGAINNDVIAAFMGTAVLLACVLLVKLPAGLSRKWGIVLGGLYALALLSKFNLAVCGVLIGVAVTWVAWRKQQWRLWLEVALLAGVVTAVLAGWWFGRNQLLYGEPTGFEKVTEIWGVRNPAESWGLALHELPYTWTSLWGRFGYGQIPLPEWIYTGLRWLVGIGLLGLVVPFIRRQWAELRAARMPLFLLILDVVLFFAVLFNYLLLSPAGAMGRFFFPALPALAVLTFYGWSQWGDWILGYWDIGILDNTSISQYPNIPNSFAWLMNGMMALLTAVSLLFFLRQAYARPPEWVAGTAVPNPTNAQFDTLAILRGYELSRDTLRPGDELTVKLYWEVTGKPPGDYLLFTHLIDENGLMVAQRDTHPGLGNFPTGQWQPGVRFVDTIRLHMPETMYAPGQANLSIGLYAPDAYRLGITAADGTGLGDALTLGTIELQPLAGEMPNPLNQNFNDKLRLVGYEYNGRTFHPGDVLAVTLYWQALAQLESDYEVEVWLCDEPCERWMSPRVTATDPLNPPSSTWATGQTISQTVLLSLGTDLPPGPYLIHVALIDPMTKEPQNVLAEDGHILDNRLLLSRVRVDP
jgi:4-amino-4-deoxy-L-arabinose transferase-like glycosyltransferase